MEALSYYQLMMRCQELEARVAELEQKYEPEPEPQWYQILKGDESCVM